VPRADVGDVVVFRRPRDANQPVHRVTRVASEPSLLPPVEATGHPD
jgi:hypothetical protein